MENLANRVLLAISEGLDYLSVIIAVLNDQVKLDTEELWAKLKSFLADKADKLKKEEDAILDDVDKLKDIEFFEQEKLRNQIRLRFSIEKFISKSFEKNGKF